MKRTLLPQAPIANGHLVAEPTGAEPMPRGPVFGWDNFNRAPKTAGQNVEELPHRIYTTSGRAAIYHALRQLALEPGRHVLVPTYHCPTMVAPVLLAGARPSYFGILPNGLPDVERIEASAARHAGAMLVPHYFGLPQSLASVRAWCDAQGIALIEDCAHSLFGAAGARSVGAWGDFATASLSKFFPVPEAGLLASAHRPLQPLPLLPQGLKAELRGFADVLEIATRHGRLTGLNGVTGSLFRLKQAWRGKPPTSTGEANDEDAFSEDSFMAGCDMHRIDRAPLTASQWLLRALPRNRVVVRRRENYALYSAELSQLRGAQALQNVAPTHAAPYVFPLWVNDADRVYQALRTQGYPVFRWDRIWPGTPQRTGDSGPLWSRHVLQLLCHQDLRTADIQRTAQALRELLD